METTEVELQFVKMLKDAGVTHEELELLVRDNNRARFGERLMTFIRTFAKEAEVDLRRVA